MPEWEKNKGKEGKGFKGKGTSGKGKGKAVGKGGSSSSATYEWWLNQAPHRPSEAQDLQEQRPDDLTPLGS